MKVLIMLAIFEAIHIETQTLRKRCALEILSGYSNAGGKAELNHGSV